MAMGGHGHVFSIGFRDDVQLFTSLPTLHVPVLDVPVVVLLFSR